MFEWLYKLISLLQNPQDKEVSAATSEGLPVSFFPNVAYIRKIRGPLYVDGPELLILEIHDGAGNRTL